MQTANIIMIDNNNIDLGVYLCHTSRYDIHYIPNMFIIKILNKDAKRLSVGKLPIKTNNRAVQQRTALLFVFI